jgi:hypothetical protein
MKHSHTPTPSHDTFRVEVLKDKTGYMETGKYWSTQVEWTVTSKREAVALANEVMGRVGHDGVRVLRHWFDKNRQGRWAIVWTPADEIPYLTEDLQPTERQHAAETKMMWEDFYA